MKNIFIFKSAKYFALLLFFIFINLGLSFAQNSTLDGVWYYVSDGDVINIRVFRGNQTGDFSFRLSGTTQHNVRPMSVSLTNFTIESVGRLNINNKIYRYCTSPLILILWESNWGMETTNFYQPVLEMNTNALIGNWIIPGDEYDIELEITANTLTLKKGRVQNVFSFSSSNYPVMTLRDSKGTNHIRNYFFFGKDIVAFNIPGEESGALIFQRRN